MVFSRNVAAALAVAVVGLAREAMAGCCPNACSGHGTCTVDDVCVCYENWQGGEQSGLSGDCGMRSCPYEVAWTDTPDKNGMFHNYAECANKGTCDRSTGECQCFEGYGGKACQRMTCPSDCSGHGRCVYASDSGYGVNLASYYHAATIALNDTDVSYSYLGDTNGNDMVTWDYSNWDNEMARVCECDAGYQGVDCSYRSCPQGNDVMNERLNRAVAVKYQVQEICLFAGTEENQYMAVGSASDLVGSTFALTFYSQLGEKFTTVPIMVDGTSGTTRTYIEDALESLPNAVIDDVGVAVAYNAAGSLGGEEEPKNCDIRVRVTFSGTQVQGNQNMLEVEWRPCSSGCTPLVSGLSLATVRGDAVDNVENNEWESLSYISQYTSADYESYECGGRGKCDYASGLCDCFTGYYGLHCQTQTALV